MSKKMASFHHFFLLNDEYKWDIRWGMSTYIPIIFGWAGPFPWFSSLGMRRVERSWWIRWAFGSDKRCNTRTEYLITSRHTSKGESGLVWKNCAEKNVRMKILRFIFVCHIIETWWHDNRSESYSIDPRATWLRTTFSGFCRVEAGTFVSILCFWNGRNPNDVIYPYYSIFFLGGSMSSLLDRICNFCYFEYVLVFFISTGQASVGGVSWHHVGFLRRCQGWHTGRLLQARRFHRYIPLMQ